MRILRPVILSSFVLLFSIILTDYFMLNRRIVSQVARTTRQQGHLILNSSRARINTAYTGTALAGISLFGTTPSIMGLFSGSKNQVDNDQAPQEPSVKKSDSEWQAQLSPEQFRVLRKQGTERPGTGEYNKFKEEGVYPIPGAVGRNIDRSMFMERIEIVCNNCGGHLGHVFKGEGLPTPTDERHCVNSVS
ncbi:hypothetical protein QFC21_004501, partial [Naganishia friedmannii]